MACHAIQIGIIIFFVLFTWTPVKIPSKEMSRNIFLAVETYVCITFLFIHPDRKLDSYSIIHVLKNRLGSCSCLPFGLYHFSRKKKHTCFDEGALKQYNQFLERNPLLFTKFSPRISTRNYFLRACTQYRKSMFYANDVVFHVKFTDLSSHFYLLTIPLLC